MKNQPVTFRLALMSGLSLAEWLAWKKTVKDTGTDRKGENKRGAEGKRRENEKSGRRVKKQTKIWRKKLRKKRRKKR